MSQHSIYIIDCTTAQIGYNYTAHTRWQHNIVIVFIQIWIAPFLYVLYKQSFVASKCRVSHSCGGLDLRLKQFLLNSIQTSTSKHRCVGVEGSPPIANLTLIFFFICYCNSSIYTMKLITCMSIKGPDVHFCHFFVLTPTTFLMFYP